ncbi:IMPACT family protein [Dietzia sp. 179-F 9C3 NHS]|uniref:IMPACT family protein n=1 Tax=Dietzia sp. 179-F 9C3 NHS TaxID=3374295 RepID=UPI00387A176D
MDPTRARVLRLSAGPDVVGEYEEKRSRFVAVLRRVDDEDAARDLAADLRKAHPAARHHCSAFLVDVPGANRIERSNDDGEPSGTAGIPMLDVLRGSGLTGVSAVVVRWFGGTKLGTGGLVRAYGAAVSAAIDAAWDAGRVVEVTRTPAWTTEVDHAVAGGLEAALRAAGAQVLGVEYGRRARMTVAGERTALEPILAARTSGGAEWELTGEATTENAAVRADVES